MSGPEVAAEIAAGLAEAGRALGQGEPVHTIRRPGANSRGSPHNTKPEPWPVFHELVGIETSRKIRDEAGSLIGRSVRVLKVGATGIEPKKGDEIAPWTTARQIAEITKFETIAEVTTKQIGGVPLSYEIILEG